MRCDQLLLCHGPDILQRRAALRLPLLLSGPVLQSEMLFDLLDTMLLCFYVLPSWQNLLQGKVPQGL